MSFQVKCPCLVAIPEAQDFFLIRLAQDVSSFLYQSLWGRRHEMLNGQAYVTYANPGGECRAPADTHKLMVEKVVILQKEIKVLLTERR